MRSIADAGADADADVRADASADAGMSVTASAKAGENGSTGVGEDVNAKPMRRAVSEADKASRRQDILAAAKTVFAERGYHATTIADIARAAGLSYGSIYWYYESKETLFHELMSAEAASLRDHINSAVSSTRREDGPEAAFKAAVRATIEFYDEDRALVTLLFRDAFALGKSFEEHLSHIQGSFVDDTERLVVMLQRQGFLGKGPSRLIAFAMTSLIGQLAHRRLRTNDGLSADSLTEFLVDLLLHGLAASPEPGRGAS